MRLRSLTRHSVFLPTLFVIQRSIVKLQIQANFVLLQEKPRKEKLRLNQETQI